LKYDCCLDKTGNNDMQKYIVDYCRYADYTGKAGKRFRFLGFFSRADFISRQPLYYFIMSLYFTF